VRKRRWKAVFKKPSIVEKGAASTGKKNLNLKPAE